MTHQDITLVALTSWRENRQSGEIGLQSIVNVIMNRASKSGDSPYAVCTQHAQFSSITMPGTEAYLWPVEADLQWQQAISLSQRASEGTLPDLTNGSTLYYAPYSIQTSETITLPTGTTIPFPQGWNAAVVKYETTIGRQVFFTES